MLCLSLKIDCKISLATNHTFQYLMFTRIQDILAVSHHVANLVLVSVGIPWYFHRLFTLNKWVGNSRIGFQCSNATIALKVNKWPKQRFFFYSLYKTFLYKLPKNRKFWCMYLLSLTDAIQSSSSLKPTEQDMLYSLKSLIYTSMSSDTYSDVTALLPRLGIGSSISNSQIALETVDTAVQRWLSADHVTLTHLLFYSRSVVFLNKMGMLKMNLPKQQVSHMVIMH